MNRIFTTTIVIFLSNQMSEEVLWQCNFQKAVSILENFWRPAAIREEKKVSLISWKSSWAGTQLELGIKVQHLNSNSFHINYNSSFHGIYILFYHFSASYSSNPKIFVAALLNSFNGLSPCKIFSLHFCWVRFLGKSSE